MVRAGKIFAEAALWAIVAAILSTAALAGTNFVLGLFGQSVPDPEWLLKLLDRLDGATPAKAARILSLFAFGALVFAPVAEELLFRGIVQSWLERATGLRIGIAAILTAILFAIAHLSLFFFPSLFCVSLCFSLAKARGGLPAAILAHFFYNAVALLPPLLELL